MAKTEKDLEQLRRQFARIPAVKPVEPAGDTIRGAASLYTTKYVISGGTMGRVTFRQFKSVSQGNAFYDDECPSLDVDLDPSNDYVNFAPAEAGWYSISAQAEITTPALGAPTTITFLINQAAGSEAYTERIVSQGQSIVKYTGDLIYRTHADSRVFYLPKWSSYPRLGVQADWPDGESATVSAVECEYWITRVG